MDSAGTQHSSTVGVPASAQSIYYLELSKEPIRFDAVSTLTNVFFDDTNRQVFAVRSGGATGIVVKGPKSDSETYSFCMDDKGPIRSIKFSTDHRVLAVQRADAEVEFITFAPQRNQPSPNEALVHRGKYGMIYGFVWIGPQEVAVISSGGIELYNVSMERRQIKSLKSVNMSIDWFSWNSQSNLTVLATNHGQMLWPILLKPGTITKLPKLVWETNRKVNERDLTLANIYGVSAILILQANALRLMEVVVYLLNGPGLAPRKAHILRLGLSGRFAMNIVDDLIVVHHQATSTSLLFDIGLTGLTDGNDVTSHDPITAPRSIRPITLPLPSLSFVSQTKSCELYSASWVLFQPDIVIDAKLGCLWYVDLKLDAMCKVMTDRVRLVEFLLQRSNGKPVLMEMLKQMMTTEYNGGTVLTQLETIFDRLNAVYERSVSAELQSQTAQPCSLKSMQPSSKVKYAAPRVLVDQNDLFNAVFTPLIDSEQIGAILLVYLSSLARLKIVAQDDLSRMIVRNLVQHQQLEVLRKLLDCGLLHESKVLACFLLSLSGTHKAIQQMALDMLDRLKDDNIIVEVLLGQGKVVDALRLAITLPGADVLPARKYLEAAHKTGDSIVFYSVYSHFVERNARVRGSPDFIKSELCAEYIDHYRDLFVK